MTEELELRIDAMLDALEDVLDYPQGINRIVTLLAEKVDEQMLEEMMKGVA